MPETPTPGELAYESWAAAFFDHTPWPKVPWADLSPPFRAAWEEAAQAVLRAWVRAVAEAAVQAVVQAAQARLAQEEDV